MYVRVYRREGIYLKFALSIFIYIIYYMGNVFNLEVRILIFEVFFWVLVIGGIFESKRLKYILIFRYMCCSSFLIFLILVDGYWGFNWY